MRIDPSVTQPALTPACVAKTGARPSDPAPVPVAAPGSPEEFALTGHLASLLSAVRQSPEVRPDVVTISAARLAAGDFNTAEAAAAAAQAILNAQPSVVE